VTEILNYQEDQNLIELLNGREISVMTAKAKIVAAELGRIAKVFEAVDGNKRDLADVAMNFCT
jgi:hypothetical protein